MPLRQVLKTTLLVVSLLAVNLALQSNSVALEANQDRVFDFHDLELKILSPDGEQTIGSTRFTVARDGSNEEIKGESKYLDGEHDSENVRLHVATAGSVPSLDTYEHSFFNADGTLHMLDMLDAKSGRASCTRYIASKVEVRNAQLPVPINSFAGPSGLMMVVGSLRRGMREIRFHTFACAPGPEIFSVEASLPDKSERWPLYPGDFVRVDLRPDLGPLNLLIAPFLPKMNAWFDPDHNWNYVGGEFDRYFRGPHVLTVRIPPPN